MNEKFNTDKDELAELLADCPDDLPLDEARRRYSDRIARDMAAYEQMWAAADEQPAQNNCYDAFISLAKKAKDCLVRLGEKLDVLLDQTIPSPEPALAFAWRGVEKGEGAGDERRATFEKFGEDCVLKVALVVRSTSVDMSFRLCSVLGEPIQPFVLTVEDLDAGTTLLKDRTFTVGEAVLRGVKTGSYRVKASGGEQVHCDFIFKID